MSLRLWKEMHKIFLKVSKTTLWAAVWATEEDLPLELRYPTASHNFVLGDVTFFATLGFILFRYIRHSDVSTFQRSATAIEAPLASIKIEIQSAVSIPTCQSPHLKNYFYVGILHILISESQLKRYSFSGSQTIYFFLSFQGIMINRLRKKQDCWTQVDTQMEILALTLCHLGTSRGSNLVTLQCDFKSSISGISYRPVVRGTRFSSFQDKT